MFGREEGTGVLWRRVFGDIGVVALVSVMAKWYLPVVVGWDDCTRRPNSGVNCPQGTGHEFVAETLGNGRNTEWRLGCTCSSGAATVCVWAGPTDVVREVNPAVLHFTQ